MKNLVGWLKIRKERKENDLTSELEFFDIKAEKEVLLSFEEDIQLAIKDYFSILYSIEERDLIQKSNWLFWPRTAWKKGT